MTEIEFVEKYLAHNAELGAEHALTVKEYRSKTLPPYPAPLTPHIADIFDELREVGAVRIIKGRFMQRSIYLPKDHPDAIVALVAERLIGNTQ